MRIAHFSDVHALSLEGVRPWQFLNKRVAGYLNLRLNRREKHPVALFRAIVEDLNARPVDHVVVTGDLTNLSLRPEFELAREILDGIALGPREVTVIPGNHDVYTLGALQDKLFWQLLAPYATGDGQAAVEFPLVRVRGEVAIIGLSTAMPSPPPLADGWLGAAQLAALDAALAAHDGKFRVILLHHPPYTNRHAILRGLRDRKRLQEIVRARGCELILHGHEHRDLRETLPGPRGPIPVIGVGSGTYNDARADRRARYNVYTIEGGQLVAVETRVHDLGSQAFVVAAA
ncbi:MAG TPA: metallophosphoesterase [Polyangia bacterium]|nr:metallophosphoesterase [Polyangia bacterium]